MSETKDLLARLRDRGHVAVRRLLGSDRYDMVPRGTADEAADKIAGLLADADAYRKTLAACEVAGREDGATITRLREEGAQFRRLLHQIIVEYEDGDCELQSFTADARKALGMPRR